MISIQGKGVSTGVALGPLYFYQRADTTLKRYEVSDPEVLEGFLTKEQQKLMKAMKTNISVLRTSYALALLSERNAAKAQKIAADFDRVAARYPYPSQVEGERELMQLASEAAAVPPPV